MSRRRTPPGTRRAPARRRSAFARLAGLAVALALSAVGHGQTDGDGADLYRRYCAACHGAEGGGGVGPALSGSPLLADGEALLARIREGGGGMPAFEGRLTDVQIETVARHVRERFGDGLGPLRTGPSGPPEAGDAREPAEEPGPPPVDASERTARGDDPAPGADDREDAGDEPGVASGRDEGGPDGATLYAQNCAACHGPEGGGGVGPALAGNTGLADGEAVIAQIRHGGDGMPAFEGRLDKEEIEAVARHVRTEYGNAEAPSATTPPPDEPALLRAFGDLRVSVHPESAEVSVRGPAGFEPVVVVGGDYAFGGVPAGGYVIEVRYGGRSYRQVVDLDAEETAEVVFRLEPADPPPGSAGEGP